MGQFQSHVGMDFHNSHANLFCFQLLNSEGRAVAVVEFDGVCVSRVLTVPSLCLRTSAIIRLAKLYFAKRAAAVSITKPVSESMQDQAAGRAKR